MTGWISVKDRLPDSEEMEQFLIYTTSGNVVAQGWQYTYWYQRGNWYQSWGDYIADRPSLSEISHWMPLPPTPDEIKQ